MFYGKLGDIPQKKGLWFIPEGKQIKLTFSYKRINPQAIHRHLLPNYQAFQDTSFWSPSSSLTYLLKTLDRHVRMDIGLYQVGSRASPPLKRGMTTAAIQSLGISDERDVEQASNAGCNYYRGSFLKERGQIV